MTLPELEKVIDERTALQIEKAKSDIKAEIGNGVADEKQLDAAVEKAVKNIIAENEKDKNSNANMLLNFEKANADASVKGLQLETPKSVVNQMIGSALFAMEHGKKANVTLVTPDELLASAQKMYPNSKALHAVLQQKVLNAGTPSEGGFTVPIAFSADYIKVLYANTILDKLGVRKVPMPNGNLSIPKMTAGARAYWVGETSKVQGSQATFGEVNLKAKKLGCLTPISNSLLRYNGVGVDEWIADDLMENARIALDDAFLNGAGTSHTPLGLKNTSGVQTVGGSSVALDVDTPIEMVAKLENANVPMSNVKWLLNPIGKSWVQGKAFASGPFAWASEMAQNKQLDGFDFISSSTVGFDSSNNVADFWLGDFSQFLWGVGYEIAIEMSREGTYDDGEGHTISAFQNDQTIVRLITEHDFACRNANAFVHGTFKKNS